jgi:hypothetical protein
MRALRPGSQVRKKATLLLVAALGGLPACDGSMGDMGSASSAGCAGGKCDSEDDGLREQLAGLDDPIARWLVDNVEGDGTIELDYLQMLRDISEQQGCTESQIDSYIISDELVTSGQGAFPRVVNTICSTDRQKADLAFFALSFPTQDRTDIDPLNVEMFAWDGTEKRYRFYKLNPAGETTAELDIEPDECRQCHLTPRNLDNHKMPMTPIMNELAAPWEHWHAEPVTVNHTVPAAIQSAPHYSAIAGSQFRKSASRLEQSIRSAYNQRVAVTRTGLRREKPASVEDAMSLLRPLFCDEQLTYATEDGASGLLDAAAVIDEGWHSVFFVTQGTGWPWPWWNDRKIRFPADGRGNAISMIPTRGAADVAYEKQLMNLRGLAPAQVARIRALDWHAPVLSEFRCALFTSALPRVLAEPPIEITESTRNAQLLEPLFEAILTLRPADHGFGGDFPEEIPLRSGQDGKLIALSGADVESLRGLASALVDGTLGEASCDPQDGAGACAVTLEEMGALLQARFRDVETRGRAVLQEAKQERGCRAAGAFGAFPHIDGLECG